MMTSDLSRLIEVEHNEQRSNFDEDALIYKINMKDIYLQMTCLSGRHFLLLDTAT